MVTAADSVALSRRARSLAWVTLVWNVAEAVIAIAAGAAANSMALIGFGLDSSMEVMSAIVIIWQLHGLEKSREHVALKLIAISFYALAGYVAVQALLNLTSGIEPSASPVGIGLAIAASIVMPILAGAKRRTGRKMGSRTVMADGKQTKLCAYLSLILLGGLIFNATVGWWWADSVAALAIAALAINEGRQAWNGESCDDSC